MLTVHKMKISPSLLHFKDSFKNAGYLKSGRFYLPDSPKLTELAKKSDLLTNLISRAYVSHCGATYQRCHPKAPMLMLESCTFHDLSSIRIRYWDNSILLVNRGLPLAAKCPTDIKMDWLAIKLEDDKLVSVTTQTEEATLSWDELIVPCPRQYVNSILYYIGHLDDDRIVSGNVTSENDDDNASSASDLARKLELLKNVASNSQKQGDKSDHHKDDSTPMEVDTPHIPP